MDYCRDVGKNETSQCVCIPFDGFSKHGYIRDRIIKRISERLGDRINKNVCFAHVPLYNFKNYVEISA